MSRYLSIECEWVDQPAAVDPIERQTWARIRINVAGRTATRLWDRATLGERQSLYIPAFPLARWIVANWWPLLYEPVRSDRLPPAEWEQPEQLAWVRRHCFCGADAGLALPRLFLYSDGETIVARWLADDADEYPHMPDQFVGADIAYLPIDEVETALREFVAAVVTRVEGIHDDAATNVRDNWQAISESDKDEKDFCRAAGKMGLDPYWLTDWPPTLVELLENGFGGDLARPAVADFLEAVEPTMAADVWAWVQETQAHYNLQGAPVATLAVKPSASPADMGYRLARGLRERMNLAAAKPLAKIPDAAAALQTLPLRIERHNHLPGGSVQATVGWHDGREPMVAGVLPESESQSRFLEARSLYHAAFACDRGPRLVTDAHTWQQKASRAFAAELLAPQGALAQRFDRTAWARDADGFVSKLAEEYNVSTRLIFHQLENAGLDLANV